MLDCGMHMGYNDDVSTLGGSEGSKGHNLLSSCVLASRVTPGTLEWGQMEQVGSGGIAGQIYLCWPCHMMLEK